jgi:hypothetical protein
MTGWRLPICRLAPAAWLLAVVVGILLVNLPALVHLVDVNPVGQAGRAVSRVTPGLIPAALSTDANTGYTAQSLGHRAALDWLHGQVPWWNPLEGIGSPLAAEMQSAAFFPPVLLFALSDGSLYFHVFLEIVAGLSTWFLLRELGLSPSIATVGGFLFGLSGTFDWLWNAPMNPVPFLPLALLGVERAFRRPGSHSGWIILAFAGALSLYAGFPETAYLDLLLVVAWAALRLTQSRKRASLAGRYVLAGTTGLLLALPLLVPVAEYLPHASTAMNPSGIGNMHFDHSATAILGLPYLYGSVAEFDRFVPSVAVQIWGPVGGFLTATTLVLGIAGLLGSRREAGLRYLLAIAVLATLCWSFGVWPYSELTRVLPYMSHIAVRRYSAPLWELSAVILACFGLEALGTDRRSRQAMVAGGAAMLASMVVTVLGTGRGLLAALSHRYGSAGAWAIGSVAWSAALVVLVTALGLGRRARLTRVLVGALVVVDAGAMAFLPQLGGFRSQTVDTAPVRYLARHLGFGRFFSFGAYHPDYGSYFGIASIGTSDAPIPQNWSDEITSRLAPNTQPWRFDGMSTEDPLGHSPVSQAFANLPAYEALDVRYLIFKDPATPIHRPTGTQAAGMRTVFDDGFVTIDDLPHPTPYFRTLGPGCTATGKTPEEAITSCTSPGMLVRSELYLPGWSATVNGRSTRVVDYQGLLTGVRLPAGRSVIRFSYTPPNIPGALVGFAVGMLLLIAIPARPRLRQRRICAPLPSPPPSSRTGPGAEVP